MSILPICEKILYCVQIDAIKTVASIQLHELENSRESWLITTLFENIFVEKASVLTKSEIKLDLNFPKATIT